MLCNFITSKIFQFSVYIFFLILSDIHMSIFAFLYSSVHNEVAVGSRQDRKMPDVHDQHGESILLIQWLSSKGLLHWFEHYKQKKKIIFLSTSLAWKHFQLFLIHEVYFSLKVHVLINLILKRSIWFLRLWKFSLSLSLPKLLWKQVHSKCNDLIDWLNEV